MLNYTNKARGEEVKRKRTHNRLTLFVYFDLLSGLPLNALLSGDHYYAFQ